MFDSSNYFASGIYSIPEAARLTRVSSSRIRRWLKGYEFLYADSLGLMKKSASPPVMNPLLPVIENTTALTFRELLEVKAVNALRQQGINWSMIRKAVKKASLRLGDPFPLSSGKVKILHKRLVVQWKDEHGQEQIEEIYATQLGIKDILRPLLRNIEFNEDQHPIRWWPMGKSAGVVIDPKRCFGKPVVHREGVSTTLLHRAYKAEGSYRRVAWWYEVSTPSVRRAVVFEQEYMRSAA